MDSLVDRAAADYAALLDRDGIGASADPAFRAQLVRQARSVATAVGAAFGVLKAASTADHSEEFGAERAQAAVHPAQSLRAGSLMFEAVFPVLAAAADDAVAVGIAVENEIQRRLAVGSIPYVDRLLTAFLSSQQSQRAHLARDLHDRIAHGMGVAQQQLELFDHYRTRDPARADAFFTAAREAVHTSVEDTRRLSAELWASMPGESLRSALESYLESTVQDGTAATVVVVGGDPVLPAEVAEELYLLLREALRNAVIHAKPTSVRVELAGRTDRFVARVVDNGCGFDVDAATAVKTGGGLASVRERGELLGGAVSITSEPGAGTTVEVSYPTPSPDRQQW